MALRTMLPSTAKVGDTIYFAFPHKRSSGSAISGFEVAINGRRVQDPEMVMTRGLGGEAANFVYRAQEPGIYQFEVIPIAGDEKGQPRRNTVEVTA
jgi:hypothetical protein